jgi:hypothetical protein
MTAMSGPDPIGRDLGRARAVRRKADSTGCVLCGEGDPELLGRQPASILEAHHVAGQVNDPDLTVTLCLNCHRRASARMPSHGVRLDRSVQVSRVERSIGLLRGLAVFCEQLAVSLMGWARQLEETVADLDDHDPGWRQIEDSDRGL